jgi:hypothetical protein
MTVILAPITGSLLLSVTKPVTEFAKNRCNKKRKIKSKCTHLVKFYWFMVPKYNLFYY